MSLFFSKSDKYRLMLQALRYARQNANVDTGNLRYNAITSRLEPYGFSITWDGNIADYWIFLETGTKYHNPYYIKSTTVTDVRNMLVEYTQKWRVPENKSDYAKMRKYENYIERERFDSRARRMEDRNELKQKSMMRAKGEVG
jgi:hypothetical protein